MYEFLKLPQPDWEKPQTTVNFYQIKEKYQVQAAPAEIILCLQQSVPNIHETDVIEYLHSVFQYSSLAFGFELFDSSSDSGENPIILKKKVKGERPIRNKPTTRDSEPILKKKVHTSYEKEEPESSASNEYVKREAKPLRMVRKRKAAENEQFDELQKEFSKNDSE